MLEQKSTVFKETRISTTYQNVQYITKIINMGRKKRRKEGKERGREGGEKKQLSPKSREMSIQTNPKMTQMLEIEDENLK